MIGIILLKFNSYVKSTKQNGPSSRKMILKVGLLVNSLRTACVLLVLHYQSLLAYDVTIIHTNDIHDRMVQFNSRGGRCDMEDAEQGECYGGVARRATIINNIRNSVPNVLFLDAGDQFQGTNWFFVYKGSSTSHFMNRLGYDVQVGCV